jgi:hypothetical protein
VFCGSPDILRTIRHIATPEGRVFGGDYSNFAFNCRSRTGCAASRVVLINRVPIILLPCYVAARNPSSQVLLLCDWNNAFPSRAQPTYGQTKNAITTLRAQPPTQPAPMQQHPSGPLPRHR